MSIQELARHDGVNEGYIEIGKKKVSNVSAVEHSKVVSSPIPSY